MESAAMVVRTEEPEPLGGAVKTPCTATSWPTVRDVGPNWRPPGWPTRPASAYTVKGAGGVGTGAGTVFTVTTESSGTFGAPNWTSGCSSRTKRVNWVALPLESVVTERMGPRNPAFC